MENSLKYFYNININNINRIGNNHYFSFQNNDFVVMECSRSLEEVNEIYMLNLYLLKFYNGYNIIPTIYGKLLFEYENKNYILMTLPDIKNRNITYKDIFDIRIIEEYKSIDKSNWNTLWSNKIDMYEELFEENKVKYSDYSSEIEYFIGMWENGITYFEESNKKYICHRRVSSDMTLLEFLNPLEFVVDSRMRDLGEYLKSYIFSYNFSKGNIEGMLEFFKIDREEVILLISRLLFPSYFFDNTDNITDEYIKKRSNITSLIRFIFNKYKDYNIPFISWISK